MMGFALTPIVIKHGEAIEGHTERLGFIVREVDRLDALLKAERDAGHLMDKRVVALETQVNELRRAAEESDRRRWTLVLALVGLALTLVVNIVLTLLRR
jgi:hypothetical protein